MFQESACDNKLFTLQVTSDIPMFLVGKMYV